MEVCVMCLSDTINKPNKPEYTILNFPNFHVCEKHLLEAIKCTNGELKVRGYNAS